MLVGFCPFYGRKRHPTDPAQGSCCSLCSVISKRPCDPESDPDPHRVQGVDMSVEPLNITTRIICSRPLALIEAIQAAWMERVR